jgi:hypothetical protein
MALDASSSSGALGSRRAMGTRARELTTVGIAETGSERIISQLSDMIIANTIDSSWTVPTIIDFVVGRDRFRNMYTVGDGSL